MTTRLESALRTDEDCHVWASVVCRASLDNCPLWDVSWIADGRDADLMLHAHEMRAVFRKFNPLVAAFEDTDPIHCGGSLRDLWCEFPHRVPK